MRFAYIADVPWWAIMRHAQGLKAHHGTDHDWDIWAVSEDAKEHSILHADLDSYDMVVYGGLPIWWMARDNGWAPSRGSRTVLVTMASFRDAAGKSINDVKTGEEISIRDCLQDHRVCGIVVNDRRMTPSVVDLELPIIVHPDRVDTYTFYPRESTRPVGSPVRVGWAGSDVHWSEIKHLSSIRKAFEGLDGFELVLQRREHEGLKTAEQMVDWYHSLDAYICANDVLTPSPVPVLEAMACGLPVITTRCGETWPVTAPDLVLNSSSVCEIQQKIKLLDWEESGVPSCVGEYIAQQTEDVLSWQHSGEAKLFTRTVAALAEVV